MELTEISKIADLTPDEENARRHNPRNVGMIVDALREVGAEHRHRRGRPDPGR